MLRFLRSWQGIAALLVLAVAIAGAAGWWMSLPPAPADPLAAFKTKGKIMIGVRADAPPFSSLDENKAFVGYEPDLGKAIASAIGVAPQFVAVDASNAVDYLKRDVVDLLIIPYANAETQSAEVKLIEPGYFASGFNAISLREGSPGKWEDLKGQAVCGLQSSAPAKQIVNEYGGSFIPFADRDSAIQALAADRCRALVNDEMALADVLKDDVDKRYRLAFDTIDPAPWTMAVRAADAGLAEFVAHQLADYHRKGFLIAQAQIWGLAASPYLESMQQSYKR